MMEYRLVWEFLLSDDGGKDQGRKDEGGGEMEVMDDMSQGYYV